MKKHQKIILVTQTHLDELNHVNNVQYVQWVQDVAKEHWQQLATPNLQEQYFWVVLNHNINYKNQAFLNDEVLIETYVQESKGVTSVRVVNMYNAKTKVILVTAKTIWCLLNKNTKKPARIPEEIITLFH